MTYPIPLKLRGKILMGFGLVTLLMLVIFFVSLSNLLHLGKASDAILQKNYLSIQAINHMLDSIEQHYRLTGDLYFQGSETKLKQLVNEQLRFEHWFFIEKSNYTETGEPEAAQQLHDAYQDYLLLCNQSRFQDFSSDSDFSQYLQARVRPQVDKVRQVCQTLLELNQNAMFNRSKTARQIAHRATWTLIVIGVLATLLAVIFSLSLSTLIVRPLKHMLKAVEKVTSGDYSARIQHHSTDELGVVSEEFNGMVQKLAEYNELNIRNILSEKQINEAILQNMDDGLILLDENYAVSHINLSAARLLNTDIQSVKQHHILELIHQETLFEYIKQTAETGRQPAFEEGQNLLTVEKGKDKLYLKYLLTPMFLPSGTLLGVLILLQDITALKQIDKLKSEFLMIASHELKTPLTSINMSISLLKETVPPKLDDRENELLQVAYEDTQRLKALISDLLDISKIEAGKIELKLEDNLADALVQRTFSSFTNLASDKEIEITADVEPDLTVHCDMAKITWVLSNLLSNALRFTPRHGHISISVKKTGHYLQFGVEDSGIGIPYEYQNKIFDKFFQVASPQNTGGTGLGLSISKEIVRAHGGTIWVESEPGLGSKFFFTLPYA